MNNESGEGRRVSAGRESLQRYLVAIRQYDLLTTSGEQRLAIASRSGLEGAQSELVQRNLRLVVRIARTYRSATIGLDELIGEGNLGLIEAVRRFDPARKVRFASYAVWWIRKYMIAAMHRGMAEATSPSPRMVPDFGEHARDGVDPNRPRRQRVLSLEEFVQTSDDDDLLERRVSHDGPDPEELTLEKELETALARVLHLLRPLERHVLEAHFGIGGARVQSLQEIGETMGCTRERVRQIERRALDRARRLIEAPRRS